MFNDFGWLMMGLIVLIFPWLLKLVFPHKVNVVEAVIASVLALSCAFVFFHTGKMVKTHDSEIYSGEIVDKKRKHSQYEEPYSCNCDSKNNCQVCYRTVYEVNWNAYSNIGTHNIERDTSYSRRIYSRPDPHRYSIIKMGDPVAMTKGFTNYVKAVPDTVFNFSSVKTEYKDLLPNYPGVYDIYLINRVFNIGNGVPDLAVWNSILSEKQKVWGYNKHANVLMVFTDKERAITESLRTHWILGKQNDIIVMIGSKKYPEIDWVEVMGWSENEDTKVAIRSNIRDLGTLQNKENVFVAIDTGLEKGFKYRDMKADFSYLEDQVRPSIGVVVFSYIFCLGIGILMIFIDIDFSNGLKLSVKPPKSKKSYSLR